MGNKNVTRERSTSPNNINGGIYETDSARSSIAGLEKGNYQEKLDNGEALSNIP